MIGELVEKSSWHSEAPAKLAAAERAQQAPVNNDEDSPVTQSSPTAVDAIPEETSNQTDVNSPYSGKFNAPNKLGDLTISENNGGWTAQFSVGTENGLAADCNVTAKSTSSKSGLLSMVLLDDDQKEQPQNVFNLQFKQNGVDVVDADYGGMCGMRANLIGFYARRK